MGRTGDGEGTHAGLPKCDKLFTRTAMTDINDEKTQPANEFQSRDITRRDFTALVVGAGIAASVSSSSTAFADIGIEIVETDVEIKTPDGTCDAAFIHPKSTPKAASYPGVLIWPDAFGLRPSFRTLGRNLASEGYSVLVPNPFYRVSKAPFTDASKFNFQNPDDMAKIRPLMASVNAPGNAERDAVAYIAFLDAQKEVNPAKKIGTQGYCMGGALVMRTAATLPERIGAGASFHGGGLVTDKPDSPHLLAPKIKARMYFGIATDDDAKQPDAKDKLRQAFSAAHVQAEIEVYPSRHGWCIPDMPMRDGSPLYDKVQAERAWGKLVALYRAALV
jgi:carboxymethylenebutenolidase